MPPKNTQNNGDDLQAESNLKRIDDLEEFRKEFEGKKFDEKICNSVKDSVPVQTEIKKLVWGVIKDKMVWIVGVIVLFLAKDVIASFLVKIADKIIE